MNSPTVVGPMLTAVVLELPHIPPLTDDPAVVAVVDCLRVGILIVGFTIAGLSFRHLFAQHAEAAMFVEAFRWRLVALLMAILYVCISVYDRLGEPVGVQFVLAIAFLLVTLRSVHLASYLPRPPLRNEAALAELIGCPNDDDRDGNHP